MSRRWALLAAFSLAGFFLAATALQAQQWPAPPEADTSYHPRNIVPWRHFGQQPGDPSQASGRPQPAEVRQVAYMTSAETPGTPAASPVNDLPLDGSSGPSPALSVTSTVASLSADYEKREQERNARRQELEAAGRNDSTLQALTDLQTTRLLLEGETDRMQTTGQIAQALAELNHKLQSRAEQVRVLLKTRREAAQEADAEVARINAETPDLNLALRNMAMLPASSDNDEFISRLNGRLNHLDETLRTNQERSQQAHLQIKGLEADEQALDQASQQAMAKAVAFKQASQDAKLNQGLLANRLEFSAERKRASDEISTTSAALQTTVAAHDSTAVQQAVLGDTRPQAPTADRLSSQADELRECIQRTGDVTSCRTRGVTRP